MMLSRRLFFACLGLAALLPSLVATVPARATGVDPAIQVVERLHDVLLYLMKATDQSMLQRRDAVAQVMENTFDFPRMTRIVVGANAWNAAGDAPRERLIHAFTALNTAIYVAQFRGWNGQRFEILGTEDGPRHTRLVHTRLVLPKDPAVELTYVLTPSDAGGWRVTDILIDKSISQLATRRADYAKILREGGLDALSAQLEKQTNALLTDVHP